MVGWKVFQRTILFFIISILLYFFISFSLLFISPSTYKLPESSNNNCTIYLFYDLAHTEIIFKGTDLTEKVTLPLHYYISDIKEGYIAFSYGDKSFMLHTPKWSDIQLPLAIAALFINTPAVIRIGHYRNIRKDKSVIPLQLTKKSCHLLQETVMKSFAQKEHKLLAIYFPDIPAYIYYFQAQKPYNLFYTCNTWTGDMLRRASLPVSYWTPLSYQVVFHFLK